MYYVLEPILSHTDFVGDVFFLPECIQSCFRDPLYRQDLLSVSGMKNKDDSQEAVVSFPYIWCQLSVLPWRNHLLSAPFLTSNTEKTPKPKHGFWQAFMWDIENMKTQLGYTIASCSFQWCAMLSDRRWLSLFWTRWKSVFNNVQLFFFDSTNSHTLCLNPCKFLASIIFSARDIHWMKTLFICYLFFFWMFFSAYNIHLMYFLHEINDCICLSITSSLASYLGWKAVICSLVPSTL